jgi:hypothetical protein
MTCSCRLTSSEVHAAPSWTHFWSSSTEPPAPGAPAATRTVFGATDSGWFFVLSMKQRLIRGPRAAAVDCAQAGAKALADAAPGTIVRSWRSP